MERSFTTFTLNDQLFGMDTLWVREVQHQLKVLPIALAPDFVEGTVALRGQIVTVLNLKTRLGLPEATMDIANAYTIILRTDLEVSHVESENEIELNEKVGFLADEMKGIITVSSEQIEPVPASIAIGEERYLAGAIWSQSDIVAILDLKRVLDPNQKARSRVSY